MASFVIPLIARTARIASSDIHTYIHTYRQTDRQKDRHRDTQTHARTHTRTHAHTHTHTRDNYCNPLCACAPRVTKLHDNFVLCIVPATKATNNVIVVCKKYYLDVVIMELGSTSTYKKVNSDCMSVINRHLDYM